MKGLKQGSGLVLIGFAMWVSCSLPRAQAADSLQSQSSAGALCQSGQPTGTPALPNTNRAVVVRHAPVLNGNGVIEGSVQQLLGEDVTLNGGFAMTGDLLAPGTPTLRTNGHPTFAGTVAGTGSVSPSGYCVLLNGNCSLRYLRTRTTPASLPVVPVPPLPAGTRSVTITSAGQSIGAGRRCAISH